MTQVKENLSIIFPLEKKERIYFNNIGSNQARNEHCLLQSHRNESDRHPGKLGPDRSAAKSSKEKNNDIWESATRYTLIGRIIEIMEKSWTEYVAGNMRRALVIAGDHVDGDYLVLCADLLQADKNACHVRRHCWPIHLHCHYFVLAVWDECRSLLWIDGTSYWRRRLALY